MQEHTLAVQRMQDYIEAHLSEPITLADLATASWFSPWYACRLFKELTGLSPAEYIRALKLSRSALRLRDENCRVIDVAESLGFGSVDGYQRAFCRRFGCNPGQYAANPIPIRLFIPYGVKYRIKEGETSSMSEVKTVFTTILNKPARKALIRRGVKADDYWSYCQEVGCDIWGLLTSVPAALGEPVCLWLPASYVKPGTSVYVQGVEVPLDYDGPVPEDFDVIELPAGEFIMFQGEPFAEEDYQEAIGALWTAMERYDMSVIGYERDPNGLRIQLEPRGSRGYIELVAVKHKS